jgi:hypothetical protein
MAGRNMPQGKGGPEGNVFRSHIKKVFLPDPPEADKYRR